ncbi:MAG: hypothetical protein JXA42_01470 [Anaerolineales bacterium]|nr:hypothetical protein [Anaerolineales bacterium]
MSNLLSRHITDPQVIYLVEKTMDSCTGILNGEHQAIYFQDDDLFYSHWTLVEQREKS